MKILRDSFSQIIILTAILVFYNLKISVVTAVEYDGGVVQELRTLKVSHPNLEKIWEKLARERRGANERRINDRIDQNISFGRLCSRSGRTNYWSVYLPSSLYTPLTYVKPQN